MEVKRERKTAKREKGVEGGERGREESVDSDESVEGECCWIWN